MALNANALTLLATQKEHLDIPALDTSFDSKLERLINTASAFIEGYTNRVVVTTTYTEYVDGRASNRIMLKQWPIQSVTSVHIDASGVFDATSLVDPANYFVETGFGIGLIGCGSSSSVGGIWPKGTRNIQIIYDAGYGTAAGGDIPNDIEQACLDYVMWLDDINTDRRVGRQTKSKGDESVSFVLDLPPHIAVLLDKYVRSEFSAEAPVGVRNI